MIRFYLLAQTRRKIDAIEIELKARTGNHIMGTRENKCEWIVPETR